MSQEDFIVANQGFPAFRADLNLNLQALASTSSGATAPATTYANQLWYDTTNDILKIRNEANSAWINVITLDQTNNKNSSITVPNIDSGTSTALTLKSGGTTALTIDTSQNIGIGTASPSGKLHVVGTLNAAGATSSIAAILVNAAETTTVSATAATGTINYDVTTQSVLYYTSNASANWTLNVRGNGTTSLNTLMSTGQTITLAFMVTQGTTAYYASAFQIDGSSVTPKYQGGTAWSSGNASGIDVYVYTITKTASATFTVLASQTQFK